MNENVNHTSEIASGYVGPERCLEIIFPDPDSRICVRTFRSLQTAGKVPYLKLGARTLFNPSEVRLALEKNYLRKAK